MRDGALRRAIKRVALVVHDARLAIHRQQADRRYDLGGECGRCSACCEEPAMQVSRLTWYFPFARHVFLAWHRHVNGFELAESHRNDRILVFHCTHFDRDAHACDTYETRPGMCRDYPRLLLEHANPDFLEGCGFRALPRNRAELVQILREHEVSPEQMQKIREGLDLDD